MTAGQLGCQQLEAIDAPRTQHELAPCAERSRAVASPSPLLAPVMTTTFPSILLLIYLPPKPFDPVRQFWAPFSLVRQLADEQCERLGVTGDP